MKLFTHRRLIKLAVAALTAALITLLTGLGVFRWMDNRVADMLFQRQELTSGRVVVIGIDEKALQESAVHRERRPDLRAESELAAVCEAC